MNFKNRLEALKWMCENVEKDIYFDYEPGYPSLPSVGVALMLPNGMIQGTGFYLQSATKFRTDQLYIPDPKPEPEPEFEWPRDLTCFLPRVTVTEKNLFDYHNALMDYLDKRFVRK